MQGVVITAPDPGTETQLGPPKGRGEAEWGEGGQPHGWVDMREGRVWIWSFGQILTPVPRLRGPASNTPQRASDGLPAPA